jgi:hypothetical protein
MDDDAAFCSKCGASQVASAPPAGPTVIHVQRPAREKTPATVSAIRILVLFLLLAIALPTCLVCGGGAYICGSTATTPKKPKTYDEPEPGQPESPVGFDPNDADAGALPDCLDPDRYAESRAAELGRPLCRREGEPVPAATKKRQPTAKKPRALMCADEASRALYASDEEFLADGLKLCPRKKTPAAEGIADPF